MNAHNFSIVTKGNHLITAMARYRMSSHDLKIERGRFNNPITPINQRICTRCESNEIDDELHLLLHCNAMNNEREFLLNSIAGIINMQSTNDIFLRIMTSRDITVEKSLAKFIYGCFKQIRVKNIEYDNCRFIFKLKYFVCVSCRA